MKSFTLIETLVAIAIFTLVFGVLMSFIIMAYRVYAYTWQQSIAIGEARKGIETMVKEIREARAGDSGSYPIEYAGDKEFIFYSNIDEDGKIERVRYFLGVVNSGIQVQECITPSRGGKCSLNFFNFLQGNLKLAQVKVSVEGDLGARNEYVEIFADGIKLGNLCQSGCTDCAETWQGTQTFDVTSLALDNSIFFLVDATSHVDPLCPHSIKAKFEFSWTEILAGAEHEFRKGIIEPAGNPPTYPLDQEKISILSSYVRNVPPIFRYFDGQGNELIDLPARLKDTKVMEVYLVINVDPDRSPQDFELRSAIQLRNLKYEPR